MLDGGRWDLFLRGQSNDSLRSGFFGFEAAIDNATGGDTLPVSNASFLATERISRHGENEFAFGFTRHGVENKPLKPNKKTHALLRNEKAHR
ncbi:MAG: hypothetical protein LBR07_10615 [Puniceicoccales bacterium]|jgi:hypothetical protein|nr:hypothetical protein [Puniceicoccales bacterium]